MAHAIASEPAIQQNCPLKRLWKKVFKKVSDWRPLRFLPVGGAVYSVERNEHVREQWTCSAEAWVTPWGGSEGHNCQQKSRIGDDDWLTDEPQNQSPWTSVMSNNQPWGAELENYWANDTQKSWGPSNAIATAYIKARSQKPRGPKPPPPPPPNHG